MKEALKQALKKHLPKHRKPSPKRQTFHFLKKRQKVDQIAEKLGIQTQEDWYGVKTSQFSKLAGNTFFSENFHSSLYNTVKTVYPEFQWNPLLFHAVPHGHWKDINNQRVLLDWCAEQMDISRQEDWYHISVEQFVSAGMGGVLFQAYGGCRYTLLKSVYPEFIWNPLMFNSIPHNFALDTNLRREVLDWAAEKLGIETQEDWYEVAGTQVFSLGTANMLTKAHNSSTNLFSILQELYPEFEWNPFRCKYSVQLSKMDFSYVREKMQDIWNISPTNPFESLKKFASSREFLRMSRLVKGGKLTTLQKTYPQYDWQSLALLSSGESTLERVLSASFSPVEKQKVLMGHQVDFYIPQFKLGFEFQGKQHYSNIHRGSFEQQRERDLRKKRDLKDIGVTLVEIPYWWNGNFDSLMTTLQKTHPETARLIGFSMNPSF